MPSWAWNPLAQGGRYIDTATGRFITNAQAEAMIAESLAASGSAVDTMASLAADKAISPRGWLTAMREEIKREYVRQYTAGIGGEDRMTRRDWSSIGGMLKEQYGHLDKFAEQLSNLSEAQIRSRAQMYVKSAREAYERAHGRVASKAGYLAEVFWVVNPHIENCQECLDRQDMGPQPAVEGGGFPVGKDVFWPGDGSTVCLCITTPESLVLTRRGWLPLLDVRVGDQVWTHKWRWRPVIGLTVKPSQLGDREVLLVHPSGRKVASTAGHLWFTEGGWVPALDLAYIDNSLPVCYPSVQEVTHEDLSKVRFSDAVGLQNGLVQIVSPGMSLRSTQRSQGDRMSIMCFESQGQSTMGRSHSREEDSEGNKSSRRGATATLRGLGRYGVAAQVRRSILELVLAGRQQQEGYGVPLSMGLGHGEWADPRWTCDPPHQRGFIGRQAGESGTDGEARSRSVAWQIVSKQQANLDLSDVRQRVQEISTPGATPKVLLGGMLPRGTAIFDLMVAEDHSFVIEGFAAHNTNCGCSLTYTNEQGEEFWAE